MSSFAWTGTVPVVRAIGKHVCIIGDGGRVQVVHADSGRVLYSLFNRGAFVRVKDGKFHVGFASHGGYSKHVTLSVSESGDIVEENVHVDSGTDMYVSPCAPVALTNGGTIGYRAGTMGRLYIRPDECSQDEWVDGPPYPMGTVRIAWNGDLVLKSGDIHAYPYDQDPKPGHYTCETNEHFKIKMTFTDVNRSCLFEIIPTVPMCEELAEMRKKETAAVIGEFRREIRSRAEDGRDWDVESLEEECEKWICKQVEGGRLPLDADELKSFKRKIADAGEVKYPEMHKVIY